MTASPSALLALTDGRFPGGGHAHSGSLEPAAAAGLVDDVAGLADFLEGRLATTGLVDAAFAAWTVAHGHEPVDWARVDAELTARLGVPALRRTSRQRGRQMARAVRRIWPGAVDAVLDAAPPDGPHGAIALAAGALAAGLEPVDAALAAAYESVTMPSTAAVRLLGLDPFAVQRLVVELGPAVEAVAARAARTAGAPLADLPAGSAPMSDILAERHATWEVRLFAS